MSAPSQRIWFLDTSSLLSMAVDEDIEAAVQRNRMTPEAAAALGEKLHDAERGPAVTASDFSDPTGRRLGRVGRP